jgi:hypothetical protein
MLWLSLSVTSLTYAFKFTHPESYRRIFVIQGTQVLVLKMHGKNETATLPCVLSHIL